MIRLVFALPPVLALTAHAIAAPGNRRSAIDHQDGTAPRPALWLVGDEGIYLMSNGLSTPTDPAEQQNPLPVYAHGYRTSAAKRSVADQIGGDDFNDVLTLLDPRHDSPSLYRQLIAGTAAGATRLLIDIDRARLDLYVDVPPDRLP